MGMIVATNDVVYIEVESGVFVDFIMEGGYMLGYMLWINGKGNVYEEFFEDGM